VYISIFLIPQVCYIFKISDPHIPGIISLDLISSCSLNRVLVSVLLSAGSLQVCVCLNVPDSLPFMSALLKYITASVQVRRGTLWCHSMWDLAFMPL